MKKIEQANNLIVIDMIQDRKEMLWHAVDMEEAHLALIKQEELTDNRINELKQSWLTMVRNCRELMKLIKLRDWQKAEIDRLSKESKEIEERIKEKEVRIEEWRCINALKAMSG